MRRDAILDLLKAAERPVKGADLASAFQVSRQVIVQDIAIMRAEGAEIMATPQGYWLNQSQREKRQQRIFACVHKTLAEMEEELSIMVSYGGVVQNVIIEHPLYGEIQANLSLSSLYEVEQFMAKVRQSNARPLSFLTDGVHLHTVEAKDEAILEVIAHKLWGKQYLINGEKFQKGT